MGQGCIQSLRDSSCVDRRWDVDLHNDNNNSCGGLLLRHFGCEDAAVDVSFLPFWLTSPFNTDPRQAFAPDGAVTRR